MNTNANSPETSNLKRKEVDFFSDNHSTYPKGIKDSRDDNFTLDI